MTNTQESWAIVIVDADWFNRAIAPMLGGPRAPGDHEVHMLTGPIHAGDHPVGIWFSKVETKFSDEQTKARTVVDLLVPWRFVESVAIEQVNHSKQSVGFQAASVTATALEPETGT